MVSFLCTVVLPGLVRADDVLLANGRSYEGVVAEAMTDGVHIQLSFGEIVLASDQVARIDKKESALSSYLERRDRLRAAPSPTADQWLALARWAWANGFAEGVREAGMLAAGLDPELDDLHALLHPLGYRFDTVVREWVDEEEFMARQGLAFDGGEWITVHELYHREASARAAVERGLEEIAEQRRLRAGRWERVQANARAQPPVVGIPVGWVGYGGGVWYTDWFRPPGSTLPSRDHDHRGHPGEHEQATGIHAGAPRPVSRTHDYHAVASRQPGSFLPLSKSPSALSESASSHHH